MGKGNGKGKKQVKSTPSVTTKAVIPRETPTFVHNNLVWCFNNIDRAGKFAFDCSRSDMEHSALFPAIVKYGGIKWKDIDAETHDRGKGKHHFLTYDTLSSDARQRIRAKNLEEDTDSIFSLSLGNLVRIIGLREQDRFEVIWFDPKHEFCPSTR